MGEPDSHASGPFNILLIHSDQHRFDCLGANGHPQIRTPSVDRLAAEGTNFTHAFTPAPICSPARASLLTGQWPTQHGCMSIPHTELYRPAREDLPTVTERLAEAGYLVGHVGKFHQETHRAPTELGVDDYVGLDEYPRWRRQQGLEPMPRERGWLGETDAHIQPHQSRLAWGAGRTIELMERYHARSRPFFLRWDPVEPHLPCVPPEPYASMYAPEAIGPWASFGDPLERKPYIQAQQRRTWELDGWPWAKWAPTVARYLAVISDLDANVGRLLAALDRLGLADRTLVVYTTDHGDLCGAHGMIDKNFVMYDDVVRVPLIARLPGVLPAGRTCDAFVCHAIDLASAFCEAAGVTPPETFMGTSLLATARGSDPNPRADIFSTFHGCQFGLYSQRMVRDRRWKYVWNATDLDELYDLGDDPAELVNRASDAACARELRRLRGRLVEWMAATEDPLLNPWIRSQLLRGLKV